MPVLDFYICFVLQINFENLLGLQIFLQFSTKIHLPADKNTANFNILPQQILTFQQIAPPPLILKSSIGPDKDHGITFKLCFWVFSTLFSTILLEYIVGVSFLPRV